MTINTGIYNEFKFFKVSLGSNAALAFWMHPDDDTGAVFLTLFGYSRAR